MTNLFAISCSMSVVILVLSLCRKTLNQNYRAKVMCILWLVVAVRLLVPVQLNFTFHQPVIELDLSQEVLDLPVLDQELPEMLLNNQNDIQISETVTNYSIQNEEPLIQQASFSLEEIMFVIWMIGAGFVLITNISGYVSVFLWLKKHCVHIKTIDHVKVYSSKVLPESFTFGVFKPSVYLSEEFLEDPWVIHHELTHCRHHDGLLQMLMCAVKSLHWFNPFVYLMERQWDADREMYCDEVVLQNKSNSERIDYMMTLYNAAESMMNKKLRFTSGLLDGEHHMIERFKQIRTNQIKRTGILMMSVLCMLIVMASGLVGCSSTSPLLNEAIEKLQDENMLERSASVKIYEEGIDGVYYLSYTADIHLNELTIEDAGVRFPNFKELDSMKATLEEAIKAGESTEKIAEIEKIVEGLQGELIKKVNNMNIEIDKYEKGTVDVLKRMNVKRVDEFEVVPNDSIEAKMEIKVSEEEVLRVDFYRSGQIIVSSGNGIVKKEKEYYQYEKEVIDELAEVMNSYKKWAWTEGPWSGYQDIADDWMIELYGLEQE